MIQLTITKTDAERVAGEVLSGQTERCAVLFASRSDPGNGRLRFIVREIEIPGPENYSQQTAIRAELRPEFVAKISKVARIRGDSIVFVHSHSGKSRPTFSKLDDIGEDRLARFLAIRIPGVAHGAIVVSNGGWLGRQLGTSMPMKIVSVGDHRQVLSDPVHLDQSVPQLYDRQVRAFGEAGQRLIQSLTVAIVGLGGTGSVAAEQLAILGVERFILIDRDEVESTNLNRVVGATASDVGRTKVDVATDHILRIAPESLVRRIRGDVTRIGAAKELLAADFILACTDSHGSRAVVQQVAYQYLIPSIDMGSVVTASDGQVTGIHGRVQALVPGLPCLTCSGLIDAEEVRRDMMNEEERRHDPYILGSREPAPSVIAINSTVTSLAITMFMAITVGIPSEGRYVLYNAKKPTLRSATVSANPTCYICSPVGVLGRGDAQVLFARDE